MKYEFCILNMRVPKPLYKQLKAAANHKKVSLSALVRTILSEFLEKTQNTSFE